MPRVNKQYTRPEIAQAFKVPFPSGIWQAGHICPSQIDDHLLLVTLDKSNHVADYDDDLKKRTFVWSSQNATKPEHKKGKGIISKEITKHLFVRAGKLGKDGKAAPFYYLGTVSYMSHTGQQPMLVKFRLNDADKIKPETYKALS